MPGRYATEEGVILARRLVPSGDAILEILTPRGPISARAKSAQRPGGRSGRLGLFHRVRFQRYERPDRELATLTQVELEEALGSSSPTRFAAQGFLAELALKTLSPEIARAGYPLLVSGLRGVARAEDPRVPLVWAGFRLLALAGHAPRGAGPYLEPAGELAKDPSPGAVYLGPEGAAALRAILTKPGKEAVAALGEAPLDRLQEALLRYAEAQLEGMRSARALRALGGYNRP